MPTNKEVMTTFTESKINLLSTQTMCRRRAVPLRRGERPTIADVIVASKARAEVYATRGLR